MSKLTIGVKTDIDPFNKACMEVQRDLEDLMFCWLVDWAAAPIDYINILGFKIWVKVLPDGRAVYIMYGSEKPIEPERYRIAPGRYRAAWAATF